METPSKAAVLGNFILRARDYLRTEYPVVTKIFGDVELEEFIHDGICSAKVFRHQKRKSTW